MTKVTHSSPTAIQTETPAIVTTVMLGNPKLSMVATILASASSFSLPPWLSTVTQKRKKEEIPLEEDDRQVSKTRVSKNKKAKTISQVMVDENHIKYAEVAKPLVEKSTKDPADYKITRVELDKQTRLSYQQDAHEVVNFLFQKNDKLWEKKVKLKEENSKKRMLFCWESLKR